MKILVVGNGGREHALAWKLLQSPNVQKVYCCPGNGGTATLNNCQNIPIKVDDFAGMKDLVQRENINLIVVGPELPLSLGIKDQLRSLNIPIFGPDQQGATIEASKSRAKDLMIEAGIPTAQSATFTDPVAAKAYITKVPIVVKADGLAAGKGVVVATDIPMAHQAVDEIFSGALGAGQTRIVVEEFLTGQEVSVLAITDGLTIRPLLPAQDHKQVGEGDTGPNTGGMGAYTPTPLIDQQLMQRIQTEVLEPTLATLQKQDINYQGIIYAGLMITPEQEPKVLEFNCRFGDPETQPILSLLETPLDQLILACCQGQLASFPPLQWKEGVAVCVVLAAGGYPGDYRQGDRITGIEEAEKQGVTVFHAGTKLTDQNEIVTAGGRVLGVTAVGIDFTEARDRAYQAINTIHFDGIYYRRDIGSRVFGK